MPPTTNWKEEGQKLADEIRELREARRQEFLSAVKLATRKGRLTAGQEHDLDVALERFFAIGARCHEKATKFATLAVLLDPSNYRRG